MAEFFETGEAPDPAYTLNRDNPNRAWLKDTVNSLWAQFQPICGDSNFQSQAKVDFHSAVWTIQVAGLLISRGLKLAKTTGHGPDLCIDLDGRRCWIEAINLNSGVGRDAVRRPPPDQTGHLPEDQIVLRITAGIREKYLKYETWILENIIPADEPYVIAINAGMLGDADLAIGPSFLEKAVFALGRAAWIINIPSGENRGVIHPHRPEIQKSNQSSVNCDGFLTNAYSGVSGIIYTPHHIANNSNRDGTDWIFVHNPMAAHPIERATFRFGVEKWVSEKAVHSFVWYHQTRWINWLYSQRHRIKSWWKHFSTRKISRSKIRIRPIRKP